MSHSMRHPKENRGWFRRGHDPRRHPLTHAERSRGGQTTARRYLCAGRWHLDWYDHCTQKVRNPKGEFVDGQEEDGNADRGSPSRRP
jgi:hypothetical protein